MDKNGPAYGIDYLPVDEPLIELATKLAEQHNAEQTSYTPQYKDNIKEIIELATNYLTTKGYDNFIEQTEYNSLVEIWKIKVKGDTEHKLVEHCDDDGGISGKVNTLIIYPIFDETVEGGELVIMEYTVDQKIFEYNITPKPKNGKICCVYMRGNVTHCIRKMSGSGIRCAIVIQLPCNRQTYDFDEDNY